MNGRERSKIVGNDGWKCSWVQTLYQEDENEGEPCVVVRKHFGRHFEYVILQKERSFLVTRS
jgi:hypothetical protein